MKPSAVAPPTITMAPRSDQNVRDDHKRRGIKGAWDRRSHHRVPTAAAIAVAIHSARIGPGTVIASNPVETVSMRSPFPVTPIGGASSVRRGGGVCRRAKSTINGIVTGRLTQKSPRHEVHVSKIPPRVGPITGPSPWNRASVPVAKVRSAGERLTVARAIAVP